MVIHGVFKIVDASVILAKYSDYYSDYGDIMKQLLYRCRDLDFVGCAKAVVKALCDAYDYIKVLMSFIFLTLIRSKAVWITLIHCVNNLTNYVIWLNGLPVLLEMIMLKTEKQ